jgi:hypothetical protein
MPGSEEYGWKSSEKANSLAAYPTGKFGLEGANRNGLAKTNTALFAYLTG